MMTRMIAARKFGIAMPTWLIAEIVTPIQLRCSRAAKVPRGTAMRIDRTMAAMTRIAVTWTLSTMTGVISAPVT